MVLFIAILSNFAQFMAHDQYFGGMSGVVYGLFGYIWVKGRLEPESGFYLPQQTVIMMLAWYVICIMGWVGNVANWAHGVGLLTGVALGFSGSLLKPFLRRR
jgi:GlpG protein